MDRHNNSRWEVRVARGVLRHRWVLIGVWLSSSAVLAHQAATRLSVRAEVERMVDEGSGAAGAPSDDRPAAPSEIAVLIQGQVWTDDFLVRLARLQREFETLKHRDGLLFDQSLSLLNAPRLTLDDDTLRSGSLSDLSGRGPAAMRDAAFEGTGIVGRLVDEPGELALLLLRGPRLDNDEVIEASRSVKRLVARHDRDGFRVLVAGLPLLKATIASLLYRDIGRLFALSVLVSLVVLLLTFRRVSGVIGPGLVIGATTVWTFGAMAVLEIPLTIVGLYLPAILTVVALGDAIHLQTMYQSLRAQAVGTHAAIEQALAATGRPMLYTTVTTCAGLLGLRTAHIEAIVELGTVGAFGIACALLQTLVVVPIVLSFERGAGSASEPLTAPRSTRSPFDRVLSWFEALSSLPRVRGIHWAAIVVAIVLVSALGISRLRVFHEMVEWLPDDNALRPAIALLDGRLAGSAPAMLRVEWPQARSVQRHETVQQLAALERDLLAYRDPQSGAALVKDVASVLDLVRGAWRVLRPPGETRELPASADMTDAMFQFLEIAAARHLGTFAAADGSSTSMELRLRWADAGSYGVLVERVRALTRHHLARDARVSMSGPVVDMSRAINALLGDLMSSFLVSCAAVSLALIFFMRRLSMGLLAMVPNLLPIALVLGVMGFVGLPLDVHTMLLSSVLLGIVVDDTIHFLHHYRIQLQQTGDVDASITASFKTAGPAIVTTSLTLALGFLTCFGSSLKHMHRMAGLLAFAIGVALLMDLVLTPALIRSWTRLERRAHRRRSVTR